MRICPICSKEFEPDMYHPYQVTCSTACSHVHSRLKRTADGRRQEERKRYLERHGDKKRKADLEYHNQTAFGGLKYDVLQRDEYKCKECGCDEVGRLIIHHIDEDKQHNEMFNLVTLCRACHARLHHSGVSSPVFKDISREDIEQAMSEASNLEEASKILGITRATLMKKRKMYNLPALDKRGRPKGSLL